MEGKRPGVQLARWLGTKRWLQRADGGGREGLELRAGEGRQDEHGKERAREERGR